MPPDPAGREQAVTALLALWRGAQDRRVDRRAYEWKVTLALWAAFGLIINSLFDYKATTGVVNPTGGPIALAVAGGAVVVAAHVSWLFRYVDRAMKYDRDVAIAYERRLAQLVPTWIAAPAGKTIGKTSWFQSVVTVALAALAIAVYVWF